MENQYIIYCSAAKLSKKQKELLQEFAETMEGSGATHSPKHESWLDAVKRFFE